MKQKSDLMPSQLAEHDKSTFRTGTSRSARLNYHFKVGWREPTAIIGALMVVLFAYLVIVPIVTLLHDAVEVQFGDARRAKSEVGTWTLYYLNRTLASPIAQILFWEPLAHTLSVATGVIVVSLSIGVPLAWLLSRSDMFGRRWFATALIVPYMLPSWTFALAWRTLFRNRTVGGQQGWFENLGFTPPDWLAYGQVPITIILALHYAPFVILLFGNALRNFDSQLEESARILGAKSG
ncbi:MAG: ABC transporter permease subunit, partial [Rhodobacteraceae bacterium]|nr:ABC transporter permease subunit [Paracoccaceae bacterium]